MQFDTAAYAQRSAGPMTTDLRRNGPALGASASNVDPAHARDLKNGDVFRRARIGIDGTSTATGTTGCCSTSAARAENAGQLYEAWVQYSGFKPFHLRVGAFSPSIGLEDQASTNGMPFLERAVVVDLARGLAAGDTRTAAALWAAGDRWLASGAFTGRTIGVINTGTASPTAADLRRPAGLRRPPRRHAAPRRRLAGPPGRPRQLCAAPGQHRRAADRPRRRRAITAQTIAFSNTPELRVDGTKLINTGNIDAKHADTVGPNSPRRSRTSCCRASTSTSTSSRADAGLSSPSFRGYYVSGTWVLTGEARKYNTQTAAFDAPPRSPIRSA